MDLLDVPVLRDRRPTTNRHGQTYSYSYCFGRQKRLSPCQQPHVSIEAIEDKVGQLWRDVVMPRSVRTGPRAAVRDLAERTQTEQTEEIEGRGARARRGDRFPRLRAGLVR